MKATLIAAAALFALNAWGQPAPVPGVPPDGGTKAAPAGAAGAAGAVSSDWLQKNLGDPAWPEALAAFIRQTPEVARIRSALEPVKELPQHLPPGLALEVGGLLEVSGSPEAAMRFYGHAARKAGSQQARTTALLASAALACDLGEDDRALHDLDDALSGLPAGELRAELAAVRLLLRHEMNPDDRTLGELREAAQALPADSPARLYALLALAEHAKAAGQAADHAKYLSQLQQDFAQSPEAALVSESPVVARALSPRKLLRRLAAGDRATQTGPTAPVVLPAPAPPPGPPLAPLPATAPAAPVRIQTGFFTVSENAAFMARDLAAAGFLTSTEKIVLAGTTYHRVFLAKPLSPDDARTTLIRLKEAGFEGVIVP